MQTSTATMMNSVEISLKTGNSHGMLSSVAAYSGAGQDLAMEPHSSVGPLQLRFSPYAFNGGIVKKKKKNWK